MPRIPAFPNGWNVSIDGTTYKVENGQLNELQK